MHWIWFCAMGVSVPPLANRPPPPILGRTNIPRLTRDVYWRCSHAHVCRQRRHILHTWLTVDDYNCCYSFMLFVKNSFEHTHSATYGMFGPKTRISITNRIIGPCIHNAAHMAKSIIAILHTVCIAWLWCYSWSYIINASNRHHIPVYSSGLE